ncbi:MAG TPA: L-arabinose isomerase [Chloroflexota bacterium]|nr:L-arabinose isomerase [Chloroflexota bacterium]
MKALGQYEVWFIVGSQELYGDETLRQVEVHAREVAAGLDGAETMPVRLVFRHVVTSAESIRRECLEADAADSCVGIVAWMHTFSPAKMWIAGLVLLQKPLLHLHTQFNRDLPWTSIDMDFMNLNQSAHGDREFGYIETRMGVARKTVVGDWHDPAVIGRVADWTRAACGWREAQSLKVARFGDNMRQVAVTEGDKVEAQMRLGVAVNGHGVTELADAVRAASDGAVSRLLDEYDERYQLIGALRPGGERRDSLREAARIEAGLRAFLEAGGFWAFTDTFEDLDGLGQLPGIAVQRLMADGYGFGAEGDWKTAALVRIVKVMAAGLPGGTSFMEDYTYHLAPGSVKVLGAHMLEVCPSITTGTPTCEIHPLSIGGKPDPVRLVFTATPGPAIVAGMLDLGDRFRLVANEVEVVEPDEPLSRLPVARAVWKPRPDLATAAEAWLLAGGPHHTVFTMALAIDPLVDFAELARLELLVIDGHTRISDFKKELRWNQAYYHLARGL